MTTSANGVITDIGTSIALNFTMPPTGTVTGSVFDFNSNPTSVWVDFSSAGSASNGFYLSGRSETDGSYTFADVALGNFSITASGGGVYGGASASLDVSDSVAVVDVTLPATASVSGTVFGVDGHTPVPGAYVVVKNLDNGYFKTEVVADNLGNYTASDVQVGNVVIEAYSYPPNSYPLSGFSNGKLTSSVPAILNVALATGFNFNRGAFTLSGADGFNYSVDGCGDLDDEGNPSYGLDNPYSWAYFLQVNGIYFSCFNFGSLAQNSREIDLGSPSIGGPVRLTRKIFSPAAGRFTRYLDVVSNPTSAVSSVTVLISSWLYSGANTRVVVDSASTNSTYAVTDALGVCCQPTVAHVFGGPGASLQAHSAHYQNGDDGVSYQWNVTIAPGQTVILMNFAVQSLDDNGAISEAQALVNLSDPDALDGMTVEERSQVVNFAVSQ